MSRHYRGSIVPALVFAGALTAACSAPTADDAEQATNDLTSSWFDANAPKGSAEEKAILALANDRSMSADEYVATCDFSLAVSAALVDYRQGDEPADTSDDRVFDALSTLDNLPFTDRPFWAAALRCAKAHYLPDDGGAGGTCATGTSSVQQSPLVMQFVLDSSASMTEQGKWDAATGALREIFSTQAAKNDPKVGVGLNVFPNGGSVPIASLDANQLRYLTDELSRKPSGSTPLYDAVSDAYTRLHAFQPAGALASATKVVVLLTDGVPDGGTSERDKVRSYVSDHVSEAQLFALGIGNIGSSSFSYDPAFVGSLAVAGGTRASSTCDPAEQTDASKMCHFQVTPGAKPAAQLKDELLSAIEKVRSNIAACDIGLQALGTGTLDPSSVTVTVKRGDGTEGTIRKHKTSGWSFDDATTPTKVLLRGKACDELRSDPQAVARVEIACK